MISKKKVLLCTFLLALGLFTGCGQSESGALIDLSGVDAAKLPLSTVQASFVYDPDNPREAVERRTMFLQARL